MLPAKKCFAGIMVLTILGLVVGYMVVNGGEKGTTNIDYPKYIGWTVKEMIEDIGYPYDEYDIHHYGTEDTLYYGCSFVYRNIINIHVVFEKEITQPADVQGFIEDIDFILNGKIDRMTVTISCEKMGK